MLYKAIRSSDLTRIQKAQVVALENDTLPLTINCTGYNGGISFVRIDDIDERDFRIKELESMLEFLLKNDTINDSSIDSEVEKLILKQWRKE